MSMKEVYLTHLLTSLESFCKDDQKCSLGIIQLSRHPLAWWPPRVMSSMLRQGMVGCFPFSRWWQGLSNRMVWNSVSWYGLFTDDDTGVGILATPLRGWSCSKCRFHSGPLGSTLTVNVLVPWTVVIVAETHLDVLVWRGPPYRAWQGVPTSYAVGTCWTAVCSFCWLYLGT